MTVLELKEYLITNAEDHAEVFICTAGGFISPINEGSITIAFEPYKDLDTGAYVAIGDVVIE